MQISTWMFKVTVFMILLFLKVNADDFLKSSYMEKYKKLRTVPLPRSNVGDLWHLPPQMRGRKGGEGKRMGERGRVPSWTFSGESGSLQPVFSALHKYWEAIKTSANEAKAVWLYTYNSVGFRVKKHLV